MKCAVLKCELVIVSKRRQKQCIVLTFGKWTFEKAAPGLRTQSLAPADTWKAGMVHHFPQSLVWVSRRY
jgi:hypothetical protein